MRRLILSVSAGLAMALSACGGAKDTAHPVDGIVLGKAWTSDILVSAGGYDRAPSSLEFMGDDKCKFTLDGNAGICSWRKLDDERLELTIAMPGFNETANVKVSEDLLVPTFSGNRVEIYKPSE